MAAGHKSSIETRIPRGQDSTEGGFWPHPLKTDFYSYTGDDRRKHFEFQGALPSNGEKDKPLHKEEDPLFFNPPVYFYKQEASNKYDFNVLPDINKNMIKQYPICLNRYPIKSNK